MIVKLPRHSCIFFCWFAVLFLWPGPTRSRAQDTPILVPVARDALPSYVDAVEAHLGYITDYCIDEYGPKTTAVWLGQIDIRKSQLPASPSSNSKNHGYWPKSNLYLDQSTMVAAAEMGRITGCKCYQESITRYLQDHLRHLKSITPDALGFSLAHDYDLSTDRFQEIISAHSFTSHTPAWEILSRESPDLVKTSIKSLVAMSISDTNRDTEKSLPTDDFSDRFATNIKLRSIAISSLAWYITQNPQARKTVRNQATLLVELSAEEHEQLPALSPNIRAMWAQALIRWGVVSVDHEIQTAIRFLLEHQDSVDSWSIKTEKQSNNDRAFNGSQSKSRTDSANAPKALLREHASLGEAYLSAWKYTKDPAFLKMAKNAAQNLEMQLKESESNPTRAETFGRLIHFFKDFSDTTGVLKYSRLAEQLADEAMELLYEPRLGMFRSSKGSDLCDARDGPGYLLIALLMLNGNDPTDSSALKF